jgi:hypothetical protein
MPSSTAARVGVQGVLDAGLLLLHLDLGRGTDVDDGDAARELGEALLELLAVVVAGGRRRSARVICSMRAWMPSVLPAPSTTVVSSFVDDDRLARGRGRRA